jgi:integrase
MSVRNRHALTDAEVATLAPHPDGRERTYRDFGVSGLMLRVGRRKRSWELRIESLPAVRKTLGEWPPIKVAAATYTARAMWERHNAGQPVDGPTKDEMTIALAWPLYAQRLRDDARSDATLLAYGHSFQRLSEGIKITPLRKLLDDRVLMANEVKRIRDKLHNQKRGGQNAAAQSAVFVSALFGFMRDRDPTLLGDPVSACQTTVPKRDDLPILGIDEMAMWWRDVQRISNPVVREALLFGLLSGLRRASLETLEWKNLNLKRGCLRVTVAKGGSERAFDLILSRPMIRCLWRARQAGRRLYPEAAARWVFTGEAGHLRGNRLTKLGVHGNHALRRGYATAATHAGVDEATVGRLLNHGGKSVTAGYIATSHLGKMLGSAQRDISEFIVRSLGSPRTLA